MPSQSYFNQLFTLYAPLYPWVSRLFKHSRKKQIDSIVHHSKSESLRVLLVGGGDGVDIPYFPQTTQIVYLDASKGMVSKAKRKYGKRSHITFVHEDINVFQEVQKFDAVCLHFCLSVTSNPESMLKKAVASMKLNGLLSIMDTSNNKLNKSNRWVNALTKWSMFDLNTNIDHLIERAELNVQLMEKNVLSELRLFNAFLYKRI